VRLVRKGARPWDIGCPLCHYLTSNRESLAEMPSMTGALAEKILSQHIYTVAEISRSSPESLAKRIGIPPATAQQLISEAGSVLEKLRRRSECRKFLRERLVPRKGRSPAKILATLKELGITELSGLAHADAATLKKAGISETETDQILTEARTLHYGQLLKDIGIPAVSLKKYIAAGITDPEMFCNKPPASVSKLTGISLSTVQRHVDLVCAYLKKPVLKKFTLLQLEKGKKELLGIRGITTAEIENLSRAGIISNTALLLADAGKLAADSGIAVGKIREFQAAIQKKKDNAIIQL